MTALYTPTSGRRSDGLLVRAFDLSVRFGRFLARIVEAEIDRRRTAALLDLEDGHLRDLGITRGEVYGAMMSAVGEKASEQLSRRRAERREGERAQARERRGTGRA